MLEIFGLGQATKFSKPFRVDVGKVVVISSFNFSCDTMNDVGEVIKKGTCAVLHKINLTTPDMPSGDGCCGCILENIDVSIANSEPVVVCCEMWTLNSCNNLLVLSVPGYYMFELCDESAIGSALIRIEELNIEQAALLPRNLIYGE